MSRPVVNRDCMEDALVLNILNIMLHMIASIIEVSAR